MSQPKTNTYCVQHTVLSAKDLTNKCERESLTLDPKGFSFWKVRETLDVVSQSAIRMLPASVTGDQRRVLCVEGGQGWGSPSRQRGSRRGSPSKSKIIKSSS